MTNRKILITGGSSYVGQHMVPYLIRQGAEVHFTYYKTPVAFDGGMAHQLDLTQREPVADLFEQVRPDVVVHLAGSNRSDQMTSIIVEGTRSIAELCQNQQIQLIHYSTDVLFDGLNPPYSERDIPNPRHAYGAAKAEAEKIVTQSQLENAAIIRPTLIYGLDQIDRGTAWMIDALKQGNPITLFTNQFRNPVWIESLITLTEALIERPFNGIVHAGGDQVLSRAEFGMRLLRWWGIETLDLVRQAPTPVDAPWPPNTTLNSQIAKQELDVNLPGVDEVLKSYSR